jgi:hypothetical protein
MVSSSVVQWHAGRLIRILVSSCQFVAAASVVLSLPIAKSEHHAVHPQF